MMNDLHISECNDINKLRDECIKQRHVLFLISECLVRESKLEITDTGAIKRIRKIMTDFPWYDEEWYDEEVSEDARTD